MFCFMLSHVKPNIDPQDRLFYPHQIGMKELIVHNIYTGNTLEGDVSDVIALDQLTSPLSPRKATRKSP